MKKIFAPLLIVLVLTSLFISCKTGVDNSDPKSVTKAFFEKMSKLDFDAAAELVTKDSKQALNMIKKVMGSTEMLGQKVSDKEKKEAEEEMTEEFKNITIGDVKIDGDNATVSITNKKEKDVIEIPLRKEDGAWKIDFKQYSGKMMNGGNEETPDLDFDKLQDSLKELPEKLKEVTPEIEKAIEEIKK